MTEQRKKKTLNGTNNMTEQQKIIAAARKRDSKIGDNAMIACGEWGYWVGSIYVSKKEIRSIK
jgi:hypothetical protein